MCKMCGQAFDTASECWLHYRASAHYEFWGPGGEDYDPTVDPEFIENLERSG